MRPLRIIFIMLLLASSVRAEIKWHTSPDSSEPYMKMESNSLNPYMAINSGGNAVIWKKVFAGEPEPLSDANLALQMTKVPRCLAETKILANQLLRYRELLRSKATSIKMVSDAGSELETRILKAVRKKDSCLPDILATYVGTSVYLLGQNWRPTVKKNGDIVYPDTAAWAYMAVAAIRQGVIRVQRNFDDEAPLKVLGTFNCSKTQITIDVVQRPLNLAATVIHEFTHLLIDSGPLNSSEVSLRESIKLLVAVEESVASLHAGYLQREFSNKVLSPQLRNKEFGDLNMFARSGPLDTLAKATDTRNGTHSYKFEEFLFQVLSHIRGDQPSRNSVADRMRTFSLKLFDRVSNGYFGSSFASLVRQSPGQVVVDGDFSNTDHPKKWTYDFPEDGYSDYSDLIRSGKTTFRRPAHPLAFGMIQKKQGARELWHDLRSAMELIWMIEEIKRPDGRANPLVDSYLPTYCETFESQATKGELNQYVGLNTNRSGTDGVKPGTDGVKPGTDGVKPGTDGVKPSKGVRTCVSIGDAV